MQPANKSEQVESTDNGPQISPLFGKATLRKHSFKIPSGFTLIEIAVVMVIVAVLFTLTAQITIGQLEANRRGDTVRNMDKVEAAFVNFVAANGRMPCPADGALPQTDANWGLEQRNPALVATNTQCVVMARGVVPWRSMGITVSEATDAWQSLFTYRVAPHLTIDNGMRMTDCDPAGTSVTLGGAASPRHLCNPACVSGAAMSNCNAPNLFLAAKGLRIENAAGLAMNDPAATPPTGAAFALISAGPTYGPAYNSSGVLVPINITLGTAEAMNQNNQAIQAYYVDSDLNVTDTANHFDDIVRRPSVAVIISKANLGPRAH